MIFAFNGNGNLTHRKSENEREVVLAFRAAANTGGSYFLGCCGMAGLENFSFVPKLTNWGDEAGFMAALFRHLYHKGTVVYALAQDQLTTQAHQLFLKLGAKEVAVFPNMYHGPRMIHLFVMNVRNICGRYCDKYGNAYAEPPKDDSEVIPEQTGPTPDPTTLYRKYSNHNCWHEGVYYYGGLAKLPVAGA